MNWQKVLVGALVGTAALSMVSCGTAARPAITTEQAAPAAEQPSASPGSMPAPSDSNQQGARPPSPVIDWATVAARLGVTEQQLRDALGELGQGPPDMAGAAKHLGISEESLRDALGLPEGVPPPGNPPPYSAQFFKPTRSEI